jgi:hypothetical protein
VTSKKTIVHGAVAFCEEQKKQITKGLSHLDEDAVFSAFTLSAGSCYTVCEGKRFLIRKSTGRRRCK